MKRITKVAIKRVIDPSPDLSWLETKIEDGKIIDSCRYTDKDIAQYGFEQVRKWAENDHRRLAEYGETWHMIGIFAEAAIQTSEDGKIWLCNAIRSSGIWNVEADSNEEYLRQLEAEQVEELRGILVDLGFPAEIDAAFARDLPASYTTGPVSGSVGIPYVDDLTEAEMRGILAGIYRWMYWREDEERWDPGKEVGGADTVQMLCELIPGPEGGGA